MIKFLSIFFLACTALFFRTEVKAETLPISEIRIFSGGNAKENLENSGLIPVEKNLNPTTGVKVYLGYATGGEPITGLLASHQYTSILECKGILYYPVSAVSLNEGTGTAAIYLYYTRDAAAGAPLLSLHPLTDSGDFDFGDYLNDGSALLRLNDGCVADLEEGVSGKSLYLNIVRENLCRPYLKALHLVKTAGASAAQAVLSAGYDYYMEDPVPGTEADPVYIACERTADPAEALTFVFFADPDASFEDDTEYEKVGELRTGKKEKALYESRDTAFGEALTDLTAGSVMAGEFTFSDWVKSFFNGPLTAARTSLLSEENYRILAENETPFTEQPVCILSPEEAPAKSGVFAVTKLMEDGWDTEKVLFTAEETEDSETSEEEISSDEENEEETSPADEENEEASEAEASGETSENGGEAEENAESGEGRTDETGEESADENGESLTETAEEGAESAEKDAELEFLYDDENPGTEPEYIGSAIGAGSLAAIACCLLGALLLVTAGIIISTKRRGNK